MSLSLNSLRLLTQRNIEHHVHQFPDSIHDASAVAEAVDQPVEKVYKTLVVLNPEPRAKPMLIMVAADRTLNLKKVAQAVKTKKVKMASHQEAEALTGLQVGGISALALLNQGFRVYIDRPAQELKTILVSAGQRGVNVELSVKDLLTLTQARWIEASQKAT